MAPRHLLPAGAISALALALPGTVLAQTGATAPGYPGNTLTVEVDQPVVAGVVIRPRWGGHAEWNEPTDETTSGYTLSLYVQDASVDPSCGPWYSQQLQKSINLPLNATTAISGFVVDEAQNISPAPPAPGVDWAGDALPFIIRPGVQRVLLCAFQRYVIDDVASSALPVDVEQPSCTPARSVRRGRSLALDCNISGKLQIKLTRGGRARTLRATADGDGNAKLSTRTLRRGTYRLSATSNGVALEGARTVRVT